MARATLQEIFESGFEDFARGRALHSREARAARCIRGCYTAEMGAHTDTCLNGDYERVQFHACRHRSCPRCAELSRVNWIDAELQRLLPCAHFHVVFTVPHSLLALWERNRTWFIKLLFDCSRQSLLQLLADPRHLGATPGLLMSLHTWGRDLAHHPHVHCLVTAGGLDENQQWRSTRPGWLLPVRPLQKLFRGKLLDALWQALSAQRLSIPPWTTELGWKQLIKRLYRAHWNVEIRPPYEHGRGVVLYLAAYAKGGPLPADRPLHLHNGYVSFDYTDHRSSRTRTLQLRQREFIARVLWHAAPRGVHTTRHVGLYSTSWREQHHLACAALGNPCASFTWPRPATPPSPRARAPSNRCPQCGGPLLRIAYLRPQHSSTPQATHHSGEISLCVAPSATGPPVPPLERGPTGRSSRQPTASAGRAPPPEYSRLRAASASRRSLLN